MKFTEEMRNKVSEYLFTHRLISGLGTQEKTCSIGAFNVAILGELTDNIPDCMSTVIGRLIIVVQDHMLEKTRNSDRWKNVLLKAYDTGKGSLERQRIKIVIDWMWEKVLPMLQPYADAHGFGRDWSAMYTLRTKQAFDELSVKLKTLQFDGFDTISRTVTWLGHVVRSIETFEHYWTSSLATSIMAGGAAMRIAAVATSASDVLDSRICEKFDVASLVEQLCDCK